jgi:hypothetical protein
MEGNLKPKILEKEDKIKVIEGLIRLKARTEFELRFTEKENERNNLEGLLNGIESNLEKTRKIIGVEKDVLYTIVNIDNLYCLEYSSIIEEIKTGYKSCENCKNHYRLENGQTITEDNIYCGKEPFLDPTDSEDAEKIIECRKKFHEPIHPADSFFSPKKIDYLLADIARRQKK